MPNTFGINFCMSRKGNYWENAVTESFFGKCSTTAEDDTSEATVMPGLNTGDRVLNNYRAQRINP